MSTAAIGTKAARQPQYAQRRRKKNAISETTQSTSTAPAVAVTNTDDERMVTNSVQIAAAYRRYVILIAIYRPADQPRAALTLSANQLVVPAPLRGCDGGLAGCRVRSARSKNASTRRWYSAPLVRR